MAESNNELFRKMLAQSFIGQFTQLWPRWSDSSKLITKQIAVNRARLPRNFKPANYDEIHINKSGKCRKWHKGCRSWGWGDKWWDHQRRSSYPAEKKIKHVDAIKYFTLGLEWAERNNIGRY